jgi:hypothetical protein
VQWYSKAKMGFKRIVKMMKEMALDVDFDPSFITTNHIE